jgi:hypothetical protein
MGTNHKPTRKKGPPKGRRRVSGNGSRGRSDATIVARVSVPVARVPVDRPTPESFRRAARNLLDEIGGEPALLEVLDASDHRNAPRLADTLRSEDEAVKSLPFDRKVLDSGLTPRELAEILYDRQKTRMFVQAANDLPEVVAGIIRRAKDRFVRCSSCYGHGRVPTKDQRKSQLPPADDAAVCLPCEGVGWELQSGETEAIGLYLELVRLRKAQVVNDFSRRTTNQNLLNNPNFFIGRDGGGSEPAGGGPPSIDAIIRRSDQRDVTLPALPAAGGQPTPSSGTYSEMPEEAVLVEDEP